MYKPQRLVSSTLLLTLTFIAGTLPVAGAPAPPAPEGFDQFAVYMATGIFDPTSPHPNPEITGCFFMFCDGHYFQEVVMGWNPTEIAEEEADAKLFFWERFGLDIDELVGTGRITYSAFTIDPRIDYRVYHLAGHRIPAGGWEVRDGGFLVVVTDPEGIELGGELAGEHAVAGASFAYGAYNILVPRPEGRPTKEIVIRYKTPRPGTPVEGPLGFVCDIEHERWGSGLAQGFLNHIPLDDGRLNFNIRNVLTFPGLGY
ncbi:MAG: hypothetical protein AAF657_31755 [Acidobacteriota bacterium]